MQVILVLVVINAWAGGEVQGVPGWKSLLSRARSGEAVAEFLVGRFFLFSDHDKAVGLDWLSKAGQQGYVPAMLLLAQAYEQGLATKIDFVQAFKWYEKAAQSGDKISQDKLAPLHALDSQNDFILFDIALNRTNRFILCYVLQKKGGKFLKRDKLCDLFVSSALLSGTDQLQACYTLNQTLAHLEYRFPPYKGSVSPFLGAVYEKLLLKYGPEEKLFGKDRLFRHLWKKRGVRIELWLELKSRTAFLRYTLPQKQEALQEQLHREKKRRLDNLVRKINNL